MTNDFEKVFDPAAEPQDYTALEMPLSRFCRR